MEDIKEVLGEIEKLAKTMLLWPEDDRISLYKKLDLYLLELEGEFCRAANKHADEVLSELKLHLIMLAHLYEPDEHTDEQHYSRALNALDKLRCL